MNLLNHAPKIENINLNYRLQEDVMKLKEYFPEAFLKIAVVGKSNFFIPYRDALVEAINDFGFESKGFDYIDYGYNPDCFLIINPFQFKDINFQHSKFIYAGIQTEQIQNEDVYCINMGIPNYKKLLKYIHKYDFIFEWSPSTYKYLRDKFRNVYFFPHCNFKDLYYKDRFHNVEEKFDIFFTGWATGIDNRRKKLLNILSERYNVFPKYQGLWGAEKAEAILSSKICLNIHFDNALVYESPRMYEYIANEKFVLTERISDSFPFIEGEDYDSFYINNMFEKIDYYLANPEERKRISTNGYKKINNFMLHDHINIILERFLLEKWVRKNEKANIKSVLSQLFNRTNKRF